MPDDGGGKWRPRAPQSAGEESVRRERVDTRSAFLLAQLEPVELDLGLFGVGPRTALAPPPFSEPERQPLFVDLFGHNVIPHAVAAFRESLREPSVVGQSGRAQGARRCVDDAWRLGFPFLVRFRAGGRGSHSTAIAVSRCAPLSVGWR